MIKAIIFDFDGVIHDTYQLAFKINTKVLGDSLTEEEYKSFFDGNIYDKPKITKEKSDSFFLIQNKEFEKLIISEESKKLIEKLARKYLLFIVTSNMGLTLNKYFFNNNLNNYFKEILGVEFHKSKVEKFNYILDKYKINKEECFFITDTLGDILEGNKAGIKSIAVDFGFHDKERLSKGNPYKIVSSYDEIIATIEKIKLNK